MTELIRKHLEFDHMAALKMDCDTVMEILLSKRRDNWR